MRCFGRGWTEEATCVIGKRGVLADVRRVPRQRRIDNGGIAGAKRPDLQLVAHLRRMSEYRRWDVSGARDPAHSSRQVAPLTISVRELVAATQGVPT